MPEGYGGAVWSVLWQTTLINSAIGTVAYWLGISLNASSFFIPFEAGFMFLFFGIMGLIAATIVSFLAGFASEEVARWAGLAIWTAVYFGNARSNNVEMQELHKALGSASGFVYPSVAAGFWWLRVVAPNNM